MYSKNILCFAIAFLCCSYHSEGIIVDSTEICGVVKRIDCASHYQEIGEETLCGTDGHTYKNKCFYVKAKCKDIHIHTAHTGSCDSSLSLLKILTGSTTEPGVAPSLHMYNISEAFCNDDSPCPSTMDPLCGTDNIFYLNLCEFNKAKCDNKELHIQTLSSCKDKNPNNTQKHK